MDSFQHQVVRKLDKLEADVPGAYQAAMMVSGLWCLK